MKIIRISLKNRKVYMKIIGSSTDRSPHVSDNQRMWQQGSEAARQYIIICAFHMAARQYLFA